MSDIHFSVPETLQYIPRGAKWSDVKNVFSCSSKCVKNKISLNIKPSA